MLGTVGSGGNCELVVSAPVAGSLFPAAQRVAASDVAVEVWRRSDPADGGSGLRLLGCRRSDDALIVEFMVRHAVDVVVETSVDGAPGSWGAKAVVPAAVIDTSGVTAVDVEVPEVVGGAVRIVATIRGNRVESAPVFVTDVVRCRPRTDVGGAPRLRQEYGIDDLITDEALASRFSRDLLRLLDYSARERAGIAAARSSGGVDVSARTDDDRWQRFLDVVAHSLGAPLTELAFPGALPSPVMVETTSWSVAEIADETELAEGEDEAAIEDIDQTLTRPARRIPPGAHGRYRAWMRRWVIAVSGPSRPRGGAAVARPALPLRMTVGALYLELLAAGVWGTDDGWRDELADLVLAIVADASEIADTPEEGHDYLGSLVAVCPAVLLQDASLHGGTPADVAARRAWEAGHGFAAGAEAGVVEALLLTSTQADARLASPAEVSAVVALAGEALADPHAEALAGFLADDFSVERRGEVWIVRGEFRNTMAVAARAVTELVLAGGTMAVATNGGRSTLMIRRGSTLVMADSTIRRWGTYQVRPPMTPASMFRGGEGVPTTRDVAPLAPVPPPVSALAESIGVDIDELVRTFLSAPSRPRRQGAAGGGKDSVIISPGSASPG